MADLFSLPSAQLASLLRLDDAQPSWLVYDLDALDRRASELQSALPGFEHCFALKAAPFKPLIELLAARGFGFEAASFPEALVAFEAAPSALILFDSPAKTRSEIERAEALGWTLSANSFAELARTSRPCSIRVNTQVGSGSISMTSVAGASSRFGEPFDQIPLDLPVAGLHAHVGSAGMSLDQMALSAARLVELASRMPQVQWINIGGGVPADGSYLAYARALRSAAPELFSGRWRVLTEMGRSLCAQSARAFTRVEYVKDQVATVHLGADFLLRRVYRPQDWSYPMRFLSPDFTAKSGPSSSWSVAGPLCFAGDLLGSIDTPAPQEGDLLEISGVGAYSLSMWSRHCSRRMPPVLGARSDGSFQWISRGETDSDLSRLWSL